jgi:CRP/FNR family transcriptional regulator, polysaccharide utilization system transcription regulator
MVKVLNPKSCEECHCRKVIFTKLTEEELDLIHLDRFQVSYKAGEIIFKQGSPAPYFFCITTGLVKIYIEGLEKNVILALVKPVEYAFGPGVYSDERHHFSLAAVEDCTACLVDMNIFKRLIRQNPGFVEEFIQRISLQMISHYEHAVSLTQKQMPGRIADTLYYLSEKIYKQNPFEMTISRQELSDLAGMSKESSIRILKEFKDEGILSVDGNTVHILKPEQLMQIREKG